MFAHACLQEDITLTCIKTPQKCSIFIKQDTTETRNAKKRVPIYHHHNPHRNNHNNHNNNNNNNNIIIIISSSSIASACSIAGCCFFFLFFFKSFNLCSLSKVTVTTPSQYKLKSPWYNLNGWRRKTPTYLLTYLLTVQIAPWLTQLDRTIFEASRFALRCLRVFWSWGETDEAGHGNSSSVQTAPWLTLFGQTTYGDTADMFEFSHLEATTSIICRQQKRNRSKKAYSYSQENDSPDYVLSLIHISEPTRPP